MIEHYIEGAYYPCGGAKRIVAAFLRELRAHAGEIKREILPRLLDLHRDPVAGHDAGADQVRGEAFDEAEKFAVGNARAVGEFDKRTVAFGGISRQRLVQVIAHDWAASARAFSERSRRFTPLLATTSPASA